MLPVFVTDCAGPSLGLLCDTSFSSRELIELNPLSMREILLSIVSIVIDETTLPDSSVHGDNFDVLSGDVVGVALTVPKVVTEV